MRNHICETLLKACVTSHITDPQGKWTHSTATSNLINAFIEASGVPYWVANIVVMEKCADYWLGCLADISRSYLRPNLASHPFVIAETHTRSNGEERVNFKAHKVSGALTRLVEDFNNPYAPEWDDRLRMDYRAKECAFFKFLYTRLIKQPDLFAGYDSEVRTWADAGIADHLPAGELRRIEAEVKQEEENAKRRAEEARAQRAAEDAARAKRAAAAAARKARKGGVA
jgi:hypothetical protein